MKKMRGIFAGIIIFALLCAPTMFALADYSESRVSSYSDDAEEQVGTGIMILNSSDLELVKDGTTQQLVGIRFANIKIPQGALIVEAYIEFQVDEEISSEQTDLTFYAHATENSPTFENGNISKRDKTETWVDWKNVPKWTGIDNTYTTPNLAPVIQQIVNMSNWQSGNAISIIITGKGSRVARAYDPLNPQKASRLVVRSESTNESTLIQRRTEWRYLDKGENLGTSWKDVNYDSSDARGWKSGAGPLGYGYCATTALSYGGVDKNKYPTYYFRKHFTVNTPLTDTQTLLLKVLRDDGCVVYINGKEVGRSNMPLGNITYNTYASACVGVVLADQTTYFPLILNKTCLAVGNNVIAVEVHQFNPSSSDIRFDLELINTITPPSVSIIKGPYQQNLQQNSITVMWETNIPSPSTIKYMYYHIYSSLKTSDDIVASAIHEMTLSNLSTNADYYCKVISANAYSYNLFKTAPAATIPNFKFAVYGDTRSNVTNHKAVVNAILTHNPRTFVLHVGDLINDGTVYKDWGTEYFTPAKSLLNSTVLYPTLGGHEKNSTCYYDFFSLPKESGTEEWYSFNYGNTHFIALHVTEYANYTYGSPQYEWLKKDLISDAARNAKWIVVFFHEPAFSSGAGGHSSNQTVIENLVSLFENNSVDLVFNGHAHFYERSLKSGITYIVSGGGGAPLHDIKQTGNEYQQEAVKAYEHCIVSVNATNIIVTAYYNNGTKLDEVVLPQSHNVGVSEMVVSSSVVRGATVAVDVAVKNTGSFSESFTVSLTDTTAGVPIGYQQIKALAPGSKRSLRFNWNTTSLSAGNHVLEAAASVVGDETDTHDNILSKISTVIQQKSQRRQKN